jgi:uncharacterized membrane protein YoaK (UPF0700 family)
MRRFAPTWVYASAGGLAGVAGFVNATAWLGAKHQGITHVTGTITDAATRVGSQPFQAFEHLLVLLAFLSGAILSGALIGGASLRLGRSYGLGLLIEGVLLVGAFLARWNAGYPLWADLLAACACGLQNALATTFSGAVLRTTHMTGVVTDLGLMLGQLLRGHAFDRWRFWLYLTLLAGFTSGGIVGGAAYSHWADAALLVPAGLVLCSAVAYWIWLPFHQRGVQVQGELPHEATR